MHSLAAKIYPTDTTPSPCESTLYCTHFESKSSSSPTRIPFFKEGPLPSPGKIFKTTFDKAEINIPESKKPKLLGFVHSKTPEPQSPNLLLQEQSPALSSVEDMKISKNQLLGYKDTKETLKLSKDLSLTFGSPEKRLEGIDVETIQQGDSSKKSDSVSIKITPKNRRPPKNLKKDVILVPKMNKRFSQLIDSNPVSPLLHPSRKKYSFNEPSIGRASVCQNASFSNQKSPSHSNYSKSFQYSELPDSIVCKSKDLLKSIETSPEKVGFLNQAQRRLI